MLLMALRKQSQVAGSDLVSQASLRRQPGEFFWGRSQRGQATKGVWGMPWHQEAMKGVEDCDKPGGSVKRELIPGFLNNPVVNT